VECESTRQLLLDLGGDAAGRLRVATALAHAEACPDCQVALADFDRMAAAARADDGSAANDADPADPTSVGVPAGGWAGFERRMAAGIAAGRGRPVGSGRQWWSARPRWVSPLAGLAAAAAVAWAGFWAGRGASLTPTAVSPAVDRPPATTVPQSTPGGDPALGPADVARRVRAFGEVDRVFDGRAGWLMVSSDASDLGLVNQAISPAGPRGVGPGRTLILVRLNLARGGVPVSDADVVIVPGATAAVTVPARGGPPVRYRIGTSAADPLRLSVRLEVPEGGPAGETSVLATSLSLQQFRNATAGKLTTAVGAYELTVTAAAGPGSPSEGTEAPGGKL
jgi:hypothetical protein